MEQLSSPKKIKETLEQFGLSPLKKLGQNFLKDANVTRRIAEAAVLPGEDVLEIGPGLGALTDVLAERAGRVVAVEIDSGMTRALSHTLAHRNNVTVLHADILKTDIKKVAEEYFSGSFAVAGNLPYYITSKCLFAVLESGAPVTRFTAMVQKEVAERLAAKAGDKDYGALTASIAYYGAVQKILNVPAGCFLPEPDVDSAVIQFTPSKTMDVERKIYARTVKALFAMRRKTVQNNLKAMLGAEEASAALELAGIDPKARAETLSPEIIARLAEIIAQS